jgi:hypothetical protein
MLSDCDVCCTGTVAGHCRLRNVIMIHGIDVLSLCVAIKVCVFVLGFTSRLEKCGEWERGRCSINRLVHELMLSFPQMKLVRTKCHVP